MPDETRQQSSFKVGDRAVAVYPEARRPGVVVADGDGLGFRADFTGAMPSRSTWIAPIDAEGRFTYSTHRHVYLVREDA